MRDGFGNQATGEIRVVNIDRTGPRLSFTQKPQLWLYGKARIILEAQDLQPDGAPGCGLARKAFSTDGEEWTDTGEYEYKEHGTVFFSSHVLESVSLTADRILLLKNGSMEELKDREWKENGDIREVLRHV